MRLNFIIVYSTYILYLNDLINISSSCFLFHDYCVLFPPFSCCAAAATGDARHLCADNSDSASFAQRESSMKRMAIKRRNDICPKSRLERRKANKKRREENFGWKPRTR